MRACPCVLADSRCPRTGRQLLRHLVGRELHFLQHLSCLNAAHRAALAVGSAPRIGQMYAIRVSTFDDSLAPYLFEHALGKVGRLGIGGGGGLSMVLGQFARDDDPDRAGAVLRVPVATSLPRSGQTPASSASLSETEVPGPIEISVVTRFRSKRLRLRLDLKSNRRLCRQMLARDGWRCQRCGRLGSLSGPSFKSPESARKRCRTQSDIALRPMSPRRPYAERNCHF